MDIKEDNDESFDEVFFGRLTLKEVKKRIFMNVRQKNIGLGGYEWKNTNNDFKIIETSSQPNIISSSHTDNMTGEHLKSTSDPLFNRNSPNLQFKSTATPDCESQDSFFEIEKNVAEHCVTTNNCDNNLDNTLEFVDFILNHAQAQSKEKSVHVSCVNKPDINSNKYIDSDKPSIDETLSSPHHKGNSHKGHNDATEMLDSKSLPTPSVPIVCKQSETALKPNNMKPAVSSALNTPISTKKVVSNLFKTPKTPASLTKNTCIKKTPSRLKTYEHIASPIANYIKNCPQVPLVKDVHPKKPLPSLSLIPKRLKDAPGSKSDKENVVLPQLAYRSAKKTVVIDVNKEKLPQSYWAQKLMSSSRKPVVLKHNHRETGGKPFLTQQEDSFQDLTLHQAEVSVCTQKLAFNKL